MKTKFCTIIFLVLNISTCFSQKVESLTEVSPDNSSTCTVTSVAVDQNGNHYIAGFYFSLLTIGSKKLTNVGSYLAKISPKDECLWLKELPGTNYYHNNPIVICDSIGGIIIASGEYYSTSNAFSPYNLLDGSYLYRMDTSGNLKWRVRTWAIEKIIADKKGNVYLSGGEDYSPHSVISKSFTNTFLNLSVVMPTKKMFYYAKVDTKGNAKWVKSISYVEKPLAYSKSFALSIDDSANVYSAFHFQDSLKIDQTTIHLPKNTIGNWHSQAMIYVKMDSSGRVKYGKSLDKAYFPVGLANVKDRLYIYSKGSDVESAFFSVIDNNGKEILIKNTSNQILNFAKSNNSLFSSGYFYYYKENFIISKIDSNNKEIWSARQDMSINNFSTLSSAHIRCFAKDKFGFVHAYGDFSKGILKLNLGFLKELTLTNTTDAKRFFYLKIKDTVNNVITEIDKKEYTNDILYSNIEPNPSEDNMNFVTEKDCTSDINLLDIFNANGSKVASYTINSRYTNLPNNNFQSGMYYYHFYSSKTSISKGQFIIRK